MAADVSSAAVTHVGLRRESNEDAFCRRPDLGLFVVADGMGGHEAGEVAAGMAVDVIESFINDTRDADLNHTWPFPFDTTRTLEANRLIAAFRLANRRVGAAIAGNAAYKGMATTAAAALVEPSGQAHIAHVGDSRVYLLRDQHLQQLTDDHSWVGEQVRAGLLSDRDAHTHPWRNVVTRAITGAEDPDVDVTEVMLQPGEMLLLCSDGLSSVVESTQIEALLTRASTVPRDLDALAARLIEVANEGGGPDNITVVLVQMHDR
jgi:serine/threonine protein phosphatase PrpC